MRNLLLIMICALFFSANSVIAQTGKIEAQVWHDKDGDGKRDDSNAAVSGITVRLLDSNNKFIKSAKTNGSGIATIKDVPVDKSVKLEFVKSSGSAFTKKDKNGVNDNEDSDADENNGRTKTFILSEEGQVVKNYDAGLILPGTVEAQVWHDKDGDGKRDDSNAAVSGVTVRLLDSNNKFIKSAKTNGSGVATIKDVPADKEVKLEFAKPSGSAFTKKDKNGVNDNEDSDADENNGRTKSFKLVDEGQVVKNYDAGLILPGTVEAQVWHDKDGDGKRDDSNAAVSGVT
ncbi:MAG: SdrD B-like domain-containing protein, partial [Bacteroidota bacterium]